MLLCLLWKHFGLARTRMPACPLARTLARSHASSHARTLARLNGWMDGRMQVHTSARTNVAPGDYDKLYPVNVAAERMYIEAEQK